MWFLFLTVGKPGITRGGQIMILLDVSCNYLQAYVHQHNLHQRPQSFSQQGPSKVCMLAEKIVPMVWSDVNPSGIFLELPYMIFDNIFSGDSIMDWLGGTVLYVMRKQSCSV